jgi:hypothetical protein
MPLLLPLAAQVVDLRDEHIGGLQQALQVG